ncbi:kielin/chordin-like protein isoform X1 [Procambarus clarkii]|uniref:kielin/chordin-like protein isoform X1 n=1 Tax=Procambarus clarkii TaxID=6728 RepID=UPI003742351F
MGVIRSSSAAALVLLTMMVATLVSSETINGDLSRLLRSGRRCKNPEECCRYERLTPEFDQCCMDHGCCPMTCDDYEIGTSVGSDCSKAWSCCRFWPQSDEFKACCGEHGCRPKCDNVSKGCCYNGMMYMFGSLVEDFPMECIQLVCAVQLSPVKPFFSAIIVPVASPLSHTCYERVPCHGTLNCVDHTGLVRAEGDGWYTDQCHYCSCRDGHVECVATPCLPPPHSHCTPVPGDCCPEWNCSAGCEDAAGVFHAIGERWPTDDPCITSVCTMEGTVLEQAVCTQAEPAHADCFQYIPLHECCPKWNCSGCTDSNGTYHSLHEEWKTDPCTTLNCTKTGIKTKRLRCPEVPAPHPSCQKSSLPGKCCPGWKCRGCFDTNGTFYELGREWSTGDPCIILVCSARGIVKKAVTCEDVPAPYPTCFKYKPFGECCYKWNCSGCLDNGTYRFVTEVWQRDACTTHVCTTDGIRTTLKNCSLGPAPHSSCQKYTPPRDCCPRWKCSGCVDEAGSYHPMNDAWKTDPCTTHTCTNNGIQTTKDHCNPGPKPYPICQAFIPKGECCSKWNCSGCIDKSRVYHKLQERWNTSRCIAHE